MDILGRDPQMHDWKITFLQQNALGLEVWHEPFEELRAPR
jgi:hypothetical protein